MTGLNLREQDQLRQLQETEALEADFIKEQQEQFQGKLDELGISPQDLELENQYIRQTREARRFGDSGAIETAHHRRIKEAQVAAEEREALRVERLESEVKGGGNTDFYDFVVGSLAGNQVTRAWINGLSDMGHNTTNGLNNIVDKIIGVKDAIPQLFVPSEDLSKITGHDFEPKGVVEAAMTTLWNFFPLFGASLKVTTVASNSVAKRFGITGVEKGFTIAKPSGATALQAPVIQTTRTLNDFGKFVNNHPRILGSVHAVIAEIPVSVLAFDPNDPTIFNHLLNAKFLQEDGTVAALIGQYLTTNPDGTNNEANTIVANALVAVFAEGVGSIIGNTLKRMKRGDQVSIEQMIKDTGDITAKDFLKVLDSAPTEIKKQLGEMLDADTRHFDEIKTEIDPENARGANDVAEQMDAEGANSYNMNPRPERNFHSDRWDPSQITEAEHTELFEAMMRSFKGSTKSLDELSMRLGASALKEPDKYQRMLINIARSLAKTMKDKKMDADAFGSEESLIQDFAQFSGVDPKQFNEQLQNITQGIVAAKPYILASKAMLKMRIERQRVFLKDYLADQSERNYARFSDERHEVEASRLLSGNLASEISDALRTYKFAKGTDDSELRNALLNKILRAPNVQFQKADAAYTKNIDDLHAGEVRAENTINTKAKKQRAFFCDRVV